MFAIAMNYPEKIDQKNKKHLNIMRRYKRFYGSIPFILPCIYCRCSTVHVISKVARLNFDGRVALMMSIYLWKSIVNEKLNAQDNKNRKNPPFEKVLAKYEGFRGCKKKQTTHAAAK